MSFWSICCQRHLLAGPYLPLHEFPIHYMAFLNVYTGNERLWWQMNLHYMNSLDTTWLFFVCILDLKGPWWLIYSLHYMSSLYTTWVFEAYAVKGICWLVPSSHYMSSQYTTWLFWTYILETNASDGWLTYTTWTPFTLHGFFWCILDLKGLWWLI